MSEERKVSGVNMIEDSEVPIEEKVAKMRASLEMLLAREPVAILLFFEAPKDGGAQVGVMGLGSPTDILALYAISPSLMEHYHEHMVEGRGKKLNG